MKYNNKINKLKKKKKKNRNNQRNIGIYILFSNIIHV